jgi:PAS domain-containing protein
MGTLVVALDAPRDADVSTGGSDVIADVSRGAERILGEGLAGKGFGELFAPEDREGALEGFRGFREQGGERWASEVQCIGREGVRVWTRLTAISCNGEGSSK